MNKEKLIGEVRKYNLLYDLNDPKYSDTLKKDKAWKEISNTLAVPASTCRKTWANLREAQRRSIKKRKTKSGQAAEKKWQYEDEMSFLLPHYKERVSQVRDSGQESSGNEDSQMSGPDGDPLIGESDAPVFEDLDYSTSANLRFSNFKRPRQFQEDESVSSLLMKLIEGKGKSKEEDDIDAFFSSIASTVKKFSEYNKAMIKSQIFNIVSQMELQEIIENRKKILQ